MLDWLINLDTKLFLFLNSIHSSFFDAVMWHVSGKLEWIPLYVVLLYFIIRRYKRKSILILASIAVLITLTDVISSQVIKDNVQRLRPSNNPDLANIVHIVNGYHGGKYGFVSSHAANCFGIALFFSLLFRKRWVTVGIVLWATLVSYSRIYLGVHYPGDVIGGAILGGCLAVLLFKLYPFLERKMYKSEV
jgi:undecaprenyl-diphosphatase